MVCNRQSLAAFQSPGPGSQHWETAEWHQEGIPGPPQTARSGVGGCPILQTILPNRPLPEAEMPRGIQSSVPAMHQPRISEAPLKALQPVSTPLHTREGTKWQPTEEGVPGPPSSYCSVAQEKGQGNGPFLVLATLHAYSTILTALPLGRTNLSLAGLVSVRGPSEAAQSERIASAAVLVLSLWLTSSAPAS